MNRTLLSLATLSLATLATSARAGTKPGPGLYIVDRELGIIFNRSDKTSPGGIGKTRVSSASFKMWGAADGSDKFQLTWKSGNKVVGTTSCKVPETEGDTDVSDINCEVGDVAKILLGAGTHHLDIGLRSAETGKVKPLASFTFGLVSWNYNGYPTEKEWGMDYDARLGEHYAELTEDGALTLHSWVKFSPTVDRAEGKVKCTANGQAVKTTTSQTTLHREHTQHDPTGKKEVIYGDLEALFVVDRKGMPTGSWSCNAMFDGKLMRVFKFEVDAKHQIVVSPAQSSGKLVHPWVAIPATEMPAGADAKRR